MMEHSSFGVVSEKIDANRYGVILKSGERVEATYYRTDTMTDFGAGSQVFCEQVPNSELWMITCHAYGNPGTTTSQWFEVDHAIYGLIDGIGRVMP